MIPFVARKLLLGSSLALSILHPNAEPAAQEARWPGQCIDLHMRHPEASSVRRYHILFEGKWSGEQVFCVTKTTTGTTVSHWSSTTLDGTVAMKHCREEHWVSEDTGHARRSIRLDTLHGWTDFEATLFYKLFAPGDSSIRAIRQSDGSYKYFRDDRPDDPKTVPNGGLRTHWTEAMIPFDSLEIMDPTRFRTSVTRVESKVGMLDGQDTRNYSVTNDDFDFTYFFRAQDGVLLRMEGREKGFSEFLDIDDLQIEFILSGAMNSACPHPEALGTSPPTAISD